MKSLLILAVLIAVVSGQGFQYCRQQSHLNYLWPVWHNETAFVQCVGIGFYFFMPCPPHGLWFDFCLQVNFLILLFS